MTSAAEQEARVVGLIRDRQYREAAEACDQMNQQYPDYESGWYTASHLAMVVKEPILAVRAIDRALVISPGRPEWLFQRVECLGALGDLNEARITAEQISGHLFQSAEVSAAFAFSLSRLGLYEDARRQYAQAIKLEPEQSSNYYNLATVERFLGDAEAAQAALTRCLALDPDDEDAHFLRAGLKTQTDEDNNVDDLQAAYIRAEGQPPKSAFATRCRKNWKTWAITIARLNICRKGLRCGVQDSSTHCKTISMPSSRFERRIQRMFLTAGSRGM